MYLYCCSRFDHESEPFGLNVIAATAHSDYHWGGGCCWEICGGNHGWCYRIYPNQFRYIYVRNVSNIRKQCHLYLKKRCQVIFSTIYCVVSVNLKQKQKLVSKGMLLPSMVMFPFNVINVSIKQNKNIV